MPYNETLLQRIREILMDKQAVFSEKKMFSGVCIMVDDKMCCGTHIDKKTGEDVLLCRLSEQDYEAALEDVSCTPMNFTGKPMKGYIYVLEIGLKNQKNLANWIQKCLDYNPLAKKSKK
ncbi:TfoX/Sxy family protein [Emticicia sp. C21]|uniref:TfoX/Sxy family protein n=1 Tax=Emticicia sp. C21 TaxID=2302915 RepID=UPI000E34A2C9|nr:TfoX/Sxy family protein [Emticicia sp. C21]RFS13542.1 RNA methyltransferase [Emticicia sp. C21]